MAEPRCVDADEEFITADGGNRDSCQDVRGVVLFLCEFKDSQKGGILTLVNCAAHIVPCLFEESAMLLLRAGYMAVGELG